MLATITQRNTEAEAKYVPPDGNHGLSAWEGGTCNRLLILAGFLTEAKENKWNVVLDGDWVTLVKLFLDEELLRSYYPFRFLDEAAGAAVPIHMRHRASKRFDCAIKRPLKAFQFIRPNADFRRMAESRFKEFIPRGTATVHVRNFEGTCKWMTKYRNSTCFFNTKKFDPCDSSPEFVRSYLPTEGLYVFTDGQNDALVERYRALENTIIAPAPLVWKGSVKQSGFSSDKALALDMWTWTLAEKHFGNVLSTCDQLVALWRHEMGKPTLPTPCWEGVYDLDLCLPMTTT